MLVDRERFAGTSNSVCPISCVSTAPVLLAEGSIRTAAWFEPNAAIPAAHACAGPFETEPEKTPTILSAVAFGFAAFQSFSIAVSCGWIAVKFAAVRQNFFVELSSGAVTPPTVSVRAFRLSIPHVTAVVPQLVATLNE